MSDHQDKQPADAERDDKQDDNAQRGDGQGAGKSDGDRKGGGKDQGDGKDDDAEKEKKPSIFSRPLFWIILIVVVAAIVIGGTLYYLDARQYESTDDAFVDAHMVRLSPTVAGTLTYVADSDNRHVQAGTLLAVVDASGSQARLSEADANVKQAEAQVDQNRAQISAAQATRDQAAAAVERAKATIAQKTLTAPFAGRLGIRKVDVGQFASPGTSLITLQQLDPIYVDFPIPEQSVALLKGDQTVEARVDPYPGVIFKGAVDIVDARIAAESRSVMVRAKFANPDRRLLPGMFTNVTVIAGAARDVVVVPRTAVSFSLYGDSVFVLTPKDETPQSGSAQAAPAAKVFTTTRRFVRTGETKEDKVAILEGLKAGETVIGEGQIKLQNGALVVIDPQASLVPRAVRPKE